MRMTVNPTKIRAATLEDYEVFTRLFAELGIDDPIPSRSRYASELLPRMFMATEDAQVVGYALHEKLDGVGYVRNLVTAPEHRGRGIGRALMQHLRHFFEDHGASLWCLNVEPTNTAAVGLYRRCGLEVAYEARALRLAMNAVLERDPSAPDVDVRTIDPSLDTQLERRFGLIAGQLASARTKAGRDVLVFSVAGQPVGLAVFDSSFPGAYPFKLEQPRLVPAALAYFRRRAPPHARWIQVVVEDDDALAADLIARGATLAVHFVHMRGQLAS
jgi:ribosomal protein S18 acetylase RimI-like enzyme